MNCVEIWRSEHACGILNIFSQMFGDIDIRELSIDLDKMDLDDTVDIDWLDIRDDSSADVLLFQDSSLLQVSDEMDELDRSIASLTLDTSSDIRNIAKEVTSVINTEDMEL
jgi:predicted nucleic acid-binding protein